jgi:hypothetical protein
MFTSVVDSSLVIKTTRLSQLTYQLNPAKSAKKEEKLDQYSTHMSILSKQSEQ